MEDHFLSTCYISLSSYYLQVEELFRIKVANKEDIVAIRPAILNKILVNGALAPSNALVRQWGHTNRVCKSRYFIRFFGLFSHPDIT